MKWSAFVQLTFVVDPTFIEKCVRYHFLGYRRYYADIFQLFVSLRKATEKFD